MKTKQTIEVNTYNDREWWLPTFKPYSKTKQLLILLWSILTFWFVLTLVVLGMTYLFASHLPIKTQQVEIVNFPQECEYKVVDEVYGNEVVIYTSMSPEMILDCMYVMLPDDSYLTIYENKFGNWMYVRDIGYYGNFSDPDYNSGEYIPDIIH